MSGARDRTRSGGRLAQLGPIAALAVAAVLRLHRLGARPVWTDEGSTWTAATLPITELLHRCVTRDASPPLFYLVTSLALRGADDEWHLRIFPALASLVLVWLTYRLARLGLGRGWSTLAALLTALSPHQLQYAQESRTYVPVAACMVGAMYVYARLQQRPGPQRWLPLVLLTAAGLWMQTIAALGVAAQGLIAVLTPTGRRRFWPWAGAMAVAGVLYLPWLIYSRTMAEHLGQSHWYIPEASPHAVFNVLRSVLVSPFPLVTAPRGSLYPGLGEYLPHVLAYVLLAVPSVLALVLTLPLVRERSAPGFVSRFCWLAWAAPVAIVVAVSVRQSLLLPRYFVFLGPFLSVLLALGVSRVRPAAGRVVLAAWLIALTFLGLFRYDRDFTKEPWRQVAEHIRGTSPPGRTAVLVPFDADPLLYYLRDGRSGILPIEVHHPQRPFSAGFTPKQLVEAAGAARLRSRDYDDVWVIVRSAGNADRRELADRTLAIAAEGRARVEDRAWTSYNAPLYVERFVRRARNDSTP
ncbi:MAG: glycosyltransferase family 39 protein [Candidatus Eisenbacteria bacterium]|nr:glycosyltransferase family 39 protein [Candidatus Eisenbacteria bacterium]